MAENEFVKWAVCLFIAIVLAVILFFAASALIPMVGMACSACLGFIWVMIMAVIAVFLSF